MLSQKIITLLFVILWTAGFAVAQLPQTDLEREEQEKREAETLKRFNKQITTFVPDLREFVPAAPDSWTISLIRNGGWARSTRILGVAKSDSNFLCREDALTKNHPISKADFDRVLSLVQSIRFESYKQQNFEDLADCPQCTIDTLVLSRRSGKKNKVVSFIFNMDDYDFEASPVRQLFDRVQIINTCPE